MGKRSTYTCDAKGCREEASRGKLKRWLRVVVGVAPMIYLDAAGKERFGAPPATRFKTVCSKDCADTLLKDFAVDHALEEDSSADEE